jgi:hypothetical protein
LQQALKGTAESFRKKLLEHMPAGKAEIILQELELSEGNGGRATIEAQKKIVIVARRLEKEGQILVPQVSDPATPVSRYGSSLKSTIKLPPGLKLDDLKPSETKDAEVVPPKKDITERLRDFMGRRPSNKARFGDDDTMNDEDKR